MNILFVTQYYPPEIGAASNRIGYFAEYLAKSGHTVSVLTSAPNYPEGKIYPGHGNRYSYQKENGVHVHRTRVFLSVNKKALSRIAHYLSFMLSALIVHRKIKKPEIIIATSPPLFVGLLGVLLKKIWRVKLVADIRDLWPESIESVGAVKHKGLLKYAEKLAAWLYKNADHITVTSPGIQKGIPSNLHDKITVIPNGAELDLFRPDVSGEGIRRRWNLNGKFVVLYTGNLGLAQAPHVMLQAAELLKEHDDIVFLIVGSGVLLNSLKQEATKKDLTNIIFTGPRPRSEMPEFVAAADLCLIPYKAKDTFRNTYPSKMFDYMAGGKPIIINLRGEASALIEEAECGVCVKEEDAKKFGEAILYLSQHRDTAVTFGQAGHAFVTKNFQRTSIADTLRHVLRLLQSR